MQTAVHHVQRCSMRLRRMRSSALADTYPNVLQCETAHAVPTWRVDVVPAAPAASLVIVCISTHCQYTLSAHVRSVHIPPCMQSMYCSSQKDGEFATMQVALQYLMRCSVYPRAEQGRETYT